MLAWKVPARKEKKKNRRHRKRKHHKDYLTLPYCIPQEFSLKGVTSPYSRWGLAPRPLLGWLSLGYPRLLPLRLVLFIVLDAWFCVLYRSALRYRRREALRSFTSPCLCALLRLFCHDCLLQFTAPPSGKGKNKARTRKEKKQRQEKKKKQR